MKPWIFALPVVLVLSLSAFAQTENPDSFDVLIMPTIVDEALDCWYKVPGQATPVFFPAKQVCRGQHFLIAIFFMKSALSEDGRVEVTFDIKVTMPDGEEYFKADGLTGCSMQSDTPGAIYLSKSAPNCRFDPEDPSGTYTIDVTAYDRVAGATCRKTETVELVPWALGEKPASREAFLGWLESYHRYQRPHEAVRAYLKFARLWTPDGEVEVIHVHFFKLIFERNTYLVGHLASCFKEAGREEQEKILLMLHLLGQLDALKEPLPEEFVPYMKKLQQVKLPDPYGPAESPIQFDMLWADFFATGRIKPIRKLVHAMEEMSPYAGKSKAFLEKGDASGVDLDDVWKDVVYSSILWSMDANCKHVPAVWHYAIFLFEYGGLSEEEKKQMAPIMGAVAQYHRKIAEEKKDPSEIRNPYFLGGEQD